MVGSHVMMIPGAWEPRRRSGAVAEPLTSVPIVRRVEGPRLDAQRPEQTSRSKLIFAVTLIIAAAIVYLLVIR